MILINSDNRPVYGVVPLVVCLIQLMVHSQDNQKAHPPASLGDGFRFFASLQPCRSAMGTSLAMLFRAKEIWRKRLRTLAVRAGLWYM